MKIYTKTGDAGETSLLGGKRVKKDCIEIEAVGEVDELNGSIGVLISALDTKEFDEVRERLLQTQHQLFTIGSNIAAVQMEIGIVPMVKEERIQEIEDWIDQMERDLHPLTQFILPGGHPAAAQSFLARAICRRAERRVVSLTTLYPALSPFVRQYLNRLSDALFVFGRWVNMKKELEDVPWVKTWYLVLSWYNAGTNTRPTKRAYVQE